MNFLAVKLIGYLLTLITTSVSLTLVAISLLDNGKLGLAIAGIFLTCGILLVWFAKILPKTRYFSVLIPGTTAILPLMNVVDVVWAGPLALATSVVLAYFLSRRIKEDKQ